ncbi:MAG: extracellular solute-binding protein [Candidatus Bathyarchaeia archaeon]|nr:extracellular solute-binding protein [Candidatus Bathyarchaeota archaeon]
MSEGKADRRTWLKTVAAAIGGILVGAAAGYYGKPKEVLERIITSTVTKTEVRTVAGPSPTPSPKPEEEMMRWWREASKPYSGTTIKVLAQAWEPNFYLRDVVGPKFTELTGIKIDWELTSNELVMEKEILDMERGTGIYDVTYDDQDMVGTWIRKGWTYDITKFMEEHPELVDPAFNPSDIFPLPYCMDARGHLLSIPAEYYPKTYVYRSDLFEDSGEKSAFKSKYGWDLRPPKYYDEMIQIAEFFTRPPDLYGSIGACGAKAHEALGFDFFETWLPSCGVTGEGFEKGYPRDILPGWGINTKTWSASTANGGMLDSPQAVRAIETFLKLGLKYAPPGVKGFIYVESAEQVAAGKVAQVITYTQFLSTFANPEVSKISGKFKVSLPPVDREYWNPNMPIGYADISGYTIPHCSPHPEAALLWQQFAVSPLNELERAKAINTTVRTSVLMNPALDAVDAKFGGIFSLIRDPTARKYFVGTPTEIGDYAPLLYEFYTTLAKAVSGELTPQQCAKELAKRVDSKLEELGYR